MRRLNLLSSYLKKRCVLFLKGEAEGAIRPDEMSMAISELSSYLRVLGLHVGVEWNARKAVDAGIALALFDFFVEFLAQAARMGESDVFCRFFEAGAPEMTFLLTEADWIERWIKDWQAHHKVSIEVRDLGYAVSVRVTAAGAETRAGKAPAAMGSEGKTR